MADRVTPPFVAEGHSSLFRDRRYLRVWLVGCLTGVVRWLELLAFGLFAWDVTHSPALVALLALLRFTPLALFGIVIGALADLLDARRMLIGGLVMILGVNCAMLALFLWGTPAYWHIALATLFSGLFWTGDLPIRRRIVGDLVDGKRLAEAMALDNATSNGTRMIGPLVGGTLYAGIGMTGVFALSVVLHALSLALVAGLAFSSTPDGTADGHGLLRPVRGAMRALAYARQDGDILRILLVTVVFNVWGFPFLAMIPVIGADDLMLTPETIGAISALEGGFALIGAIALAWLARPETYRRIYYFGSFAYLVAVFFIGIAPATATLAVGMCAAGLAASCLATMQSTLIYACAPPDMRGRFLGLLTLCIGTGLIGFANVGLMAEWFGASNALWIIGLEGAIPMLLIARGWRELANGTAGASQDGG